MSAELTQPTSGERSSGTLPEGEDIRKNVAGRQRRGKIYQGLLFATTLIAIFILGLLLFNVINDAFGGVAIQSTTEEETLTGGRPLDELSQPELVLLLEENLRSRVLGNLNREQPLAERDAAALIDLINAELIQPELVEIYTLTEYLFNREAILAELAEDYPRAELEFKSWVSGDFVTEPMSSQPVDAGVRTALFGTLWMLAMTVVIAFPLGIGAAIFIEEYEDAKPFDERKAWGRFLNKSLVRINSLIGLNIYNLSGVPSIIYGILGLAIFVRALEPLTSGSLFGVGGDATANGRTIIAASMTMALLILPIVIISSQEAVRAVPSSLRQASYGLGATKWQTVSRIVLPNALPGILTGTILAMSRAIGETAPLIVVGASTFIVTDPSGPFSKFTALPIQIYNWTSRPQDEFRAIAAAAIIVLLVLLLSVNAVAIIIRNNLRAKRVS